MAKMTLPSEELRLLSRNLAKDILQQFRVLMEREDETAIMLWKGVATELYNLYDELLNTEEAASLLGLSVGALKQYCKRIGGNEPEIPFHNFHGKKYFSKKELITHLLQKAKGFSK